MPKGGHSGSGGGWAVFDEPQVAKHFNDLKIEIAPVTRIDMDALEKAEFQIREGVCDKPGYSRHRGTPWNHLNLRRDSCRLESRCTNMDQCGCQGAVVKPWMAEKLDHFWIVEVLKDIEAYATSHDQPKVAALIFAARGALSNLLEGEVASGRAAGTIEEQWFDIVLDELARYCHVHGLIATEEHLLAALAAWHEAQEKRRFDAKVVTFVPRR
jgi:hypothetical protein